MSKVAYHLSELKIALDQNDVRRILPNVLDSDRTLLDIGCGIGQTFLALDCRDRTCIGIDIDEAVIRYGIENYGDRIQFILADAKRIPLPSGLFDLVYSRVSLPYTNIPKVIGEARRVLRKGGRIWMTLHSRSMAVDYFRESIRARSIKRLGLAAYSLMNGYLLAFFGRVVPFVNGRYESWQSEPAMTDLLRRHGFEVSVSHAGRHMVIEGRLV